MWLFDLFSSILHILCRVTDISKYFNVSIGLRANERRLYLILRETYVLDICKPRLTEEQRYNAVLSFCSVKGINTKFCSVFFISSKTTKTMLHCVVKG